MPLETVDFSAIHDLLRYRPGVASRDVTVAHENGVMTVTTGGQTRQCAYIDTSPERMIRKLLAHYPVPAAVNRTPVAANPFPDQAALSCEQPSGPILSPQRKHAGRSTVEGFPKEGLMLVEGLAYAYDPPRPDLTGLEVHNNTMAIVPEPEGRQPHYWQARVYQARPNYRWEPDDEYQRQASRFTLTSWRHPWCHPDRAGWLKLCATAERQLSAAAARIREASGVAAVAWQYPIHAFEIHTTYRGWSPNMGEGSIATDGDGRAVLIADGSTMGQAVQYSIAPALYRNNCQELVPVAAPRANQQLPELPRVSCARVVITRPDGSETVHDPAEETERCYTLNPAPHGTNARSIVAHLVVTEPDGTESRRQAPLDIYMHGSRYDESIWTTGRMTAGDRENLHEQIYGAFWDWHGGGSETDEEEYFRHCQVLQARILEDEQTAFIAELQQLCDRFRPQCRSSQQSVTVSNDRHSLTWTVKAPPSP